MKVRITIFIAALVASLFSQALAAQAVGANVHSIEQSVAAGKGVSDPKPKKPDPGSVIVMQWRDASNKRVLLRVGRYFDDGDNSGNGFGWVKIVRKHRILSPLSIKFVTRAPGGGTRSGTEYIYDAYANRKECVRNSCYYTDSVKVRAVVSWSAPKKHWGVRLYGGVIGVKTTYCMNADRAWACPTWVDLALGSAKSSTSGQSHRTTTEWSYAPLTTRGGHK